MKKVVFFIPAFFWLFAIQAIAQKNSAAVTTYVSFLKNQKQSAKDYILNLFKSHDIVIICERDHRELTQYDLFLDIIRDKRFIKNVGNVFTELGVSNLNPALNNFLHTKGLTEKEQQQQILNFHRNMDWTVQWEKYSYTYLMQNLYELNSELPDENMINLYPSNIPLDWNNVDSNNYKQIVQPLIDKRDSIIAMQIVQQFDKIKNSSADHKKALVIMNYRHAFNQDILMQGKYKIANVSAYLFKHYGNKVANVLLNGLGIDIKGNQQMLQQGKWDAAFNLIGNKTVGFDLSNSPLGKDSFDLWPYPNSYIYQQIFTGFIFYKPVEEMKLVTGIPGFVDSAYFDEFVRRFQLSALILPNLQAFSEKIAGYKNNLLHLQKQFNEMKEEPYQNLDNLLQARNQWLK